MHKLDEGTFDTTKLNTGIRLFIDAGTVLSPSPLSQGAQEYRITAFYRDTQCKGGMFCGSEVKVYRKNADTHSPPTRKQIKGPLMVVAILAALDRMQLPKFCQSQAMEINRSGRPTHPFSAVQENVGGHATRFNRLVDPDSVLSRITDATGPIPKSLEMMWLSGV